MTLLRNGLARALFLTFLIICAGLVFLNFYLSGKLRRLAPGYLDRFSKLSGFTLHADEAGLDPLFRIRLDGVKVIDASPAQKRLAEIESLTIDPHILSSLFSRRVMIGEIIIDSPLIRYDGASARRVRDLIKGGEGGGKGSRIAIDRISSNGARLEIGPDTAFTSEALNIRIEGKGVRSESRVSIDGDVSVYGNGMDVEGIVNVKPGETSGRIKIVTDKSLPGSSPESLFSAHNLKGVSEITFRAGDTVDSRGEISILSLDGVSGSSGGVLGKLEYALVYDGKEDTAHVNMLSFDVMNVVSGALGGDINDVTGDLSIDLEGSLSSGDPNPLSKLVPRVDGETLTGNIRSDNLRVGGSAAKNDIALTGKIVLDGVGFAYKDESLRVSGLGCGMDVKQHIGGKSGFSFTSRGTCSADEFFEKDIGGVEGLGAGVYIRSGGFWSGKELLLSNLSGSYMDGAVTGSLKITSGEGESEIDGSLNGVGLNLEKAPESIAPFDMAGTVETVSADIKGEGGTYKAGITFAVNDFIMRSKTGREFKVSKAASGGQLDLEYVENAGDGERKIVVRDRGLSYENLSFGEYFIKGGKVEDLLFSLVLGGDWTLGMASRGWGFQVLGMDVHLEEFKEHIDIESSGRRGFSGTLDGTGGRFKSVDFPALSAEYVFSGNSIDIRKLSARVSSIGELRSEDFRVKFGGEGGGYPYEILLKDGTFTGYENKLTSEGISGGFIVNNPESGKTPWEGSLSAEKSNMASQALEGLRLNVAPSADGIILKDITARFMNGNLRGRIDVITSGSAPRIVTDLGLVNAAVKSGDLDIALGSADFDFSGSLSGGSLPEGTGKLVFDSLSVKRQGLGMLYGGGVNTRTIGETLFIEDGFMRYKDESELRFSGKMENSLGGGRNLEILFPDFALATAVKFLSPLLPVTVKEGRIVGTAGFTLEFNKLFETGNTWNGSLSFKGASFTAYIGGADLSLRGINGVITVKDEGKGGNALASLMDGALTLDSAVYKEYLRTFKESAAAGADRVGIDEIEYGVLKFEDVECALEADRNKVGIIKLSAGFFGGSLYASGALDFDKAGGAYNFSFLFNDISLDAISKRLSPSEEYITGRVNGLVWLTGWGGDLSTIDGPFEFWSVSSDKEPRSIGKALLDKLGAKERLILGSSRSYDNGEISGYISDGVMTFRKFNISNSILGIKNLSIQADPVKNSISIAHLVSVIREIARRSQSGGPTIETQ